MFFWIYTLPFLLVQSLFVLLAVLEHDKAKASKKYNDLEHAMHQLGNHDE